LPIKLRYHHNGGVVFNFSTPSKTIINRLNRYPSGL
jgi:hypothetical protein